MNYVFHSVTKQLLDSFIKQPKSSLLVVGQPGSGRTTAINYLLEGILGPKRSAGQVLRLAEYNIEAMRQLLLRLSRTKAAGESVRLAAIDDVDKLQPAAQTVLLKTLEEPPPGSHFILSASPASLPETIVSRCQLVRLRRADKAELFKLFPDQASEELEQAYLIADGWSGDMTNYLLDVDCPLNQQIKLAKDYLTKDGEARTIYLLNKDNQEQLDNLLGGLLRLSQAGLRTTATNNSSETQVWLKRFEELYQLREIFPSGENRRALALGIAAIF